MFTWLKRLWLGAPRRDDIGQLTEALAQYQALPVTAPDFKRYMAHPIGTYASSIIELIGWAREAVVVITDRQSSPSHWRQQQAVLSQRTLDDVLSHQGYTLYPEDYREELIQAVTAWITTFDGLAETDETDSLSYYERHYGPITHDLLQVMEALTQP